MTAIKDMGKVLIDSIEYIDLLNARDENKEIKELLIGLAEDTHRNKELFDWYNNHLEQVNCQKIPKVIRSNSKDEN